MLKRCLPFILFPTLILAQYWGERVTEQSFENNDLFFQPYFLNPVGLDDMEDAAVGSYPDSRLDLALNPALMPADSSAPLHLYIDFRGEQSPDYGYTVMPAYYDIYSSIVPDPRWYTGSADIPKALFSLAAMKQLALGRRSLLLSGSWQMIEQQGPFYSSPYLIYNTRYGYDSFGTALDEGGGGIPVENRYSSSDNMQHRGHLLQGILSLNWTEKLNLGLSADGILYERSGLYEQAYRDEFSDEILDYSSLSEQEKSFDYSHINVTAGAVRSFGSSSRAGLSAGFLTGRAEQLSSYQNDYFYRQNTEDVSETWNVYSSEAFTDQHWERPGTAVHGSLFMERTLREGRRFRLFYSLLSAQTDLISGSNISDSSYSSYRWVSDNSGWQSEGMSYTYDLRSSAGEHTRSMQQAGLILSWGEGSSRRVQGGVIYMQDEQRTEAKEDVLLSRFREYESLSSGESSGYYSSLYSLKEKKTVTWTGSTFKKELHFPFWALLDLSPSWRITLGLDRVLRSWTVENETLAVFSYRESIENEQSSSHSDFAESYLTAPQTISEDALEFFIAARYAVSPDMTVELQLDPDFPGVFNVSQWFLSLQTAF